MQRFFALIVFFISLAAYAQQPTGLPRPETRDVPERWQDPTTLFLIIALAVVIVGAIVYFIRFDKSLGRRWRK